MQLDSHYGSLHVLARDHFFIWIDSRFQLSWNIANLMSLSTGKFAQVQVQLKAFQDQLYLLPKNRRHRFVHVTWNESIYVETGELRWKSFISASDHQLSLNHAECLYAFSEDVDGRREKKLKLKTFTIIWASCKKQI